MSKRLIVVALVAGLIGFVLGNAFWYLASPLWIDNVVNEASSVAESAEVLANGNFQGADSVHSGAGNVTVYRDEGGSTVARFTDFEVTNGPDLKVWLVAHPNVTEADEVTSSPYLSLGRLKGNIGDQNYDIPADTDLAEYRSVVIWCEQFGVLFAAAGLRE